MKPKKVTALLFAIAVCAITTGVSAETSAERDARMKWWRDARFGMFIHWGLYSIPAGEWKGKPIAGIGEWIMKRATIPVAEYEQLAKQFNPVKFDAKKFVAAVQNNPGQVSPFLLYMDFDSGHGTGKTNQQRVVDRDYELRFLMSALGVGTE